LEKSLLTNKMKISIEDEKIGTYSKRHERFYMGYSSFVFRALQKPKFQNFLCWMLKKERIEAQNVKAVHINVLPLRRKGGRGIAGKCNPALGKIRIYPKTVKFCQTFKRNFGRDNLSVYAGNRARAALIHELLHLKYSTDEKTVRELSEEYFCIFTSKQSTKNLNAFSLRKMVFTSKLTASDLVQTTCP
jgi:hypothetical protein